MFFCALTNRYINRKPDEVKGHTSGKKYKKALEQCEQMVTVCARYRDGDDPSEGRKCGDDPRHFGDVVRLNNIEEDVDILCLQTMLGN